MEQDRMKELAGLINESSLPTKAFSGSGYRNPTVWFSTERQPKGIGTWYYLWSDGWFRMHNDHHSDGSGLMIRSMKVDTRLHKRDMNKDGHSAYRAFIQYLPSSFDDWDDDKPKNYERMWIMLYIRDSLGIGPEDVESYVRSEMHKWRP
jgi:hypothetical protein